jgi:hypothetical protein
MDRGNMYKCVVCGKEHQFCPKCQIVKPNYDYERYCSKEHADIFNILSKHGCNLATPEETLEAINGYDLTGLNDEIQAHIYSLVPKKARARKEVVSDEESTQE